MKLISSQTKQVLSLALPAALKHLVDILQVLVDMLMVGRVGVASLGAVGIAMQFLMFLNVLMTLYVVGGNSLIARLIGSGRKKRASRMVFSLAFFALVLSSVVAFVLYPWSEFLYGLMGASSEIALEGERYFGTILLGLPLLFLDNLLYNALSAAGDTKSSLYIKLISTLINALANYALIFGHFGFDAMGVEGAAIATLLSYGFNVVVYMWLLLYQSEAKLLFYPRINIADIKAALSIGYPAAIDRGISVFSFLLFVSIIANYGVAELAGYQVGLRIEGVAFMPGLGFAIASMALVGQSLGAKKEQKAYEMGLTTAKIAAYFMGTVGVFLIVFSSFFAGFFTNDAKTIEVASSYLFWVGLAQIPLAFTFVFSASLRSAAQTKTVMRVNVFSLWFLRVIPSYIAYRFHLEIVAIFIIMNIETLIKGVIFYRIYQAKKWLKGK